MALYLGIDVGSNESKAVVVDETLKVVASVTRSHAMLNPRPGWFSHDAEKTWWGDFCGLCHDLAGAGVDLDEVACVGHSALGCDCVPVDERGTALDEAILYGVDSRVTDQIAQLSERFAGREEEVFGHMLCTSDVAPKILWFVQERPEVAARTAYWLTGSSYLCAKLTGRFTIDRYLAEDFMPLYDLATDSVDVAGCEGICDPSQLARVMSATDIAGGVCERAAAETGLKEGTPVLVGTGDSGAEAVSCGVFTPGDVMVQLGSSCYFVLLTDHLVDEPRFWPGTFIIPGTWSVCAGTNTAGTLTKVLRDELYRDALAAEAEGGENAFAVMVEEAKGVAPGADGLVFLPYLAGERTPIDDPAARGVLLGLTTNHTRAHVVRAAIEGICCTIAAHFRVFEEDCLPVRKVMIVGGGTKNAVWAQCVADMLERPVHVSPVTLGAAYGDALMAALAGGAYASWEEMGHAVRPAMTYEPNPETFPVYRRLRERFDALYAVTAPLMHEVAIEQDAGAERAD